MSLSIPSYPITPNSTSSSDGRPKLARQEADPFLSYYQSRLADERYTPVLDGDKVSPTPVPVHTRQVSRGSSSSDYSSDYIINERSDINIGRKTESSAQVRRRPSIPSDGGGDRRRMAIIEMNSSGDHDHASLSKLSADNDSDGALYSSHNTLRSRRGLEERLGSLALVAPPDASPDTYSYLTPPSTAPIIGDKRVRSPDIDRVKDSDGISGGHQRSASEAVTSGRIRHKSSRDVGIVGTIHSSVTSERSARAEQYTDDQTLRPPIFQMPKSRSPSPADASDTSENNSHRELSSHISTSRNSRHTHPILTPEIGQEKDINVPVASPIVLNLGSATALRPTTSLAKEQVGNGSAPRIMVQPASVSPSKLSSYLNYQPGVHATAGPLPPPPRAAFNIDLKSPAPPRPPRLNSPQPSRRRGDMDSVRQALQLPPSVTAKLASRTPSPTPPNGSPKISSTTNLTAQSSGETEESTNSSPEMPHVHTREGAFPPSVIVSPQSSTILPESEGATSHTSSSQLTGVMEDLVADVENAIDDAGIMKASDVPPPTVIEPLRPAGEQRSAMELHRDDSWVSYNSNRYNRTTPSSDEGRPSSDLSRSPQQSTSIQGHVGDTPSPPPKNLRNSLTVNPKRMSTLPGTSSRMSSDASSRTSSPPSVLPVPLPPRRKIRSRWPAAMSCTEIVAKRNAAERSMAYAQKINELYMYDCGLGDWVIEASYKGRNSNRPSHRTTLMPSGPSTNQFSPQIRHTSRSSTVSEATFPRRPDASLATDLSLKAMLDSSPATAPPPLPYPSLANQRASPSRSSTLASPPTSLRTLTSPISTGRSGGFFASLGRKASMSKKDKTAPSPTSSSSSSSKVLTKSPPANNFPRPVNISNSPSVPGGPRAPPNRLQRSQTIMISAPFSSNSQQFDRDGLTRRPSLYGISSEPVLDIQSDPEFLRQVDKLADLLPQADRVVLAGYLRRAGQDILAIGQYLEDEKNGTIRT